MAYYSFDTPEEGEALREKGLKYDYTTRNSMRNSLTLSKKEVDDLLNNKTTYVIRFKTPENVDVTFKDTILGDITINTSTLDDKVLLKSNGIGSYHLCNVCDDHDMGITHVLRGQEWINSTPMHVLLYKAFGWDIPTFAHLPLIMNPDGKGKLSKRTSSKYGIPISAIGYTDSNGIYQKGWREVGFEPQVLINALSLIGWNPGDERDILTMDELIESFSLEHVSKSGARFDFDKAKWINSQWIQHKISNDELFGNKFVHLNTEQRDILFAEVKKRCHFRQDIQIELDKIFIRGKIIDISNDEIKLLGNFQTHIINSSWNTKYELENIISEFMISNNLKNNFLGFLRKTILFGVQGVDVKSCIFILGKEEVFERLSNFIISKEIFELQ
jgi:glutamyl-tRNA synthetase